MERAPLAGYQLSAVGFLFLLIAPQDKGAAMPNGQDDPREPGYTRTLRAFCRRSSFHSPSWLTQTHVPERDSDPQV